MKKYFIVALLVFVCFGFASRVGAVNTGFFINFGMSTPDDFKFKTLYWYGGGSLDIYVTEMIMITPEVNVLTYKFKDLWWLEPAILANFRFGSMFVGAGVAKHYKLGGDLKFLKKVFLRLNIGFSDSPGWRLCFFTDMQFDSLFKNMIFGVKLGIGF